MYDTALRACQRAFEGGYPRSAAKDAFVGFAISANILEETSALPAWMIPPMLVVAAPRLKDTSVSSPTGCCLIGGQWFPPFLPGHRSGAIRNPVPDKY
ncbi:DUF982 domain-containing protein [Mesorhizobium sp. ZC-5]|uniref:DUF982 domain-containing protein n=1 Tax=Mesorhizobium sp. ZC-5 TaxID=2986066 RepID=UPI0021E6F971|nr:DUF982 domain-containing protein [Mesorhizobium sp. ZC-5]MCV3243189.1 DUF982 domain-containing protein [Mesorhizobium sp. ZC-5]